MRVFLAEVDGFNPAKELTAKTDISFATSDDSINSTSTDLSIYKKGDRITVEGSSSNNGTLTAASDGTATKVLVTENLTDEAAGASITLSAVEKLYFSSDGIRAFPPGDADRPNQLYEDRIVEPGNFARFLFSEGETSGLTETGFGALILSNADRGLDSLIDFGFDGRELCIYSGEEGDAFASFQLLFCGTIEQSQFTFSERDPAQLVFRIRDRHAILDVPIQTTRYLGDNSGGSGAEGTAEDIKDQTKPLLYGKRFNIRATLVNESKLIYQIHDGSINAINAVYDAGVALTASGNDRADLTALEANTPAASNFDTCLALGLFRLGSNPAGDITCDAEGDNTGGYVNTVADIVQRIVTTRTELISGDLLTATFTALNTTNNAEVGVYIESGEEPQVSEIVSGELADSIGAFFAFNKDGKLFTGRFEAPAGADVLDIGEDDFIKIEKLPIRDTETGLPTHRVNLHYKKVGLVQLGGALAGSVANSRREFVGREFRTIKSEDTAVKRKHLLSPELDRLTALNSESDANTEAARLLALYKGRRERYVIEIERNDTVDLNDVISLSINRFGLGSAKLARVIGITQIYSRNITRLEAWL